MTNILSTQSETRELFGSEEGIPGHVHLPQKIYEENRNLVLN